MFLKRAIISWRLRSKCSDCGKRGKPLDDRNFSCDKHGAWDGSAQFAEQINYEKNRYAVSRDLVNN